MYFVYFIYCIMGSHNMKGATRGLFGEDAR